jgi:hypothetical protein
MWSEREREGEGSVKKGAGIFRRPRCCDGGEADFFFFFLGRDEKNPTETRWSSKKGGGPRERKRVGPLNMLCLYTSPLFFSPSLSSKRVGGKLWKIRKDMITLFDLLLLYFGFFLM